MKAMKTTEVPASAGGGNKFRCACVASCRKVLAQIRRAKAAIFAESRPALRAEERFLRLALNEAEAVAWQTCYPHLLFPVLATEKVESLAAWTARQRAMWRSNRNPDSALAA